MAGKRNFHGVNPRGLDAVDPIREVWFETLGKAVSVEVASIQVAGEHIMKDIHEAIRKIRGDFPFFSPENPSSNWVFLDNAATTQKPQVVIDALVDFYSNYNANIHRGLYELSERATLAYETARKKIATFLNANSPNEVVFTRGATESLNLLASCWGGTHLEAGDEVLVTEMEHHANIVPWQMVAEATGAKVVRVPISDDGLLDLEFAEEKLKSGKVKCLSIVHISNAMGVKNDVEKLVKLAVERGIFSVVDGAQAVSHFAVDVQAIGCDAYVFSGHKLFGPTGIGVLWAKQSVLEAIPPYQGGGDMIRKVTFEGTTFAEPPSKFEAGTPHISGAIGLGAAIDYVNQVGFDLISQIDHMLFEKTASVIESIPGLRRIGKTDAQLGVVSFYSDSIHPSDIATFLSVDKIAVRTGHHCAQPLMERMKIPGTVRVSFSIYNEVAELDRLHASLTKAIQMLG